MKVIVFHTGARDEYQVARALEERGLLFKLVTNAFRLESPKGFARLLGRSARFRSRLRARSCPQIPDAHVDDNLLPELLTVAAGGVTTRMGDRAFAWQERVLARRVASLAVEARAEAVLSYNYCAYHAFRALQKTGVKLFLFQCHPHPDTVRELLSREIALHPEWGRSVLEEKEFGWGEDYLNQLRMEAHLADHVFAASDFTRRSLESAGIPRSKITVIPYGCDSRLSAYESIPRPEHAKQVILFVGQMGQRKGISYLLEACARMDMTGKQLRLCGRGFELPAEMRGAMPSWLVVQRDLTDAQLAAEYKGADVFVLPSIVEGFGLVLLEALAFGLPVITTQNTGGPDIMKDGVEGRIVPAGDAEALADALREVLESALLRAAMSSAAREAASRYSWQAFRTAIGEHVERLLRLKAEGLHHGQ